MRKNTTEDFWSKVAQSDSCWRWTGYCLHNGYGQFRLSGQVWLTHRLSWTLAYGPIADGLDVLHRCDNPPCVRPDHLFLGTNADNAADRDRKGRGASGDRHWSRTHPERLARGSANGSRVHPDRLRRGDQHGRARLNAGAVVAIREAHADGVSTTTLARDFGVTDTAIRFVIQRRNWRHVP